MGPAVDTAGNPSFVSDVVWRVRASMGPAVDTAGNLAATQESSPTAVLLQWGQRLIPLETQCRALRRRMNPYRFNAASG